MGSHYRIRESHGVVRRVCLLLMIRGRRGGHRRARSQRAKQLSEGSELKDWPIVREGKC
jgi:hypothetical protein